MTTQNCYPPLTTMKVTWLEGILGGQTSASIFVVISTDPYKPRQSAVLRAGFQALAGLTQEIEFVEGEGEALVKKESHSEYGLQRPGWAGGQALQRVPVLKFPIDCTWTMVL